MLDNFTLTKHTGPMHTTVSQEAMHRLMEAQGSGRVNDLSVPSNAEEQRELFLGDHIENPIFFRELLTDFSQLDKINSTARYRSALAKLALPDQEKKVFETFAESLDTEIALGEIGKEYAIAQLSGSVSNEITARFIALRTEIFGVLPIDRYKQAVHRVLHKFDGVEEINEEVLNYLEYIQSRIGHSEAHILDTMLSEDSIARVEQAVRAFDLDPRITNPQEINNADQFSLTMKKYLHSVLQATDWDATAANILEPASTDRLKSVVNFRNDTNMNDGTRVIEVIAHEGFHSYRAILAQQLGSAALLIGLPGSQNVEEGFASIFGKVYSDTTKSLDSFDYPVFVAGLMDHEGYDFRTSFEVFWRALAVIRYSSKNKSLHQNAKEESRKLAYKILCSETRLFDRPRYRSLGNAAGVRTAWKYLDEHHDDPLALETLLIGKHDPSNPDHIRFLHNLI